MPLSLPKFSSSVPRVFLAVPFSDDFKKQASAYQDALKSTFQEVHWIPPANFHLTVKFFGETKLEKLEKILRALSDILAVFPEHELTFSDFGFFGTPRSPRVLFLKGESEILEQIAGAVLKKYPDENPRPFRAHLTLGKFLKRQSANALSHNEKQLRIWQKEGPSGIGLPKVKTKAKISELVMMETLFIGRAVEYEIRFSYPLKRRVG